MLLHFKPERTTELRQLEEDNGLPTNSIMHARWIKLPHRRVADQTCSHAIFTLSEPAAANKILTDGLIVCQKWVYTEKCRKEPTHCLKCHGWGHMSYNCPQHYDVCGTCTGHHHTPDCTNRAHPRCVSCQVTGHASWDRQCPTFTHKCEEMNARLTENQMPYFLMDELWTHISQPPRPLYQHPPVTANASGPQSSQQGPSHRQSTLLSQPSQGCVRGSPQPADPFSQAHGIPVTGTNGTMPEHPFRWGSHDDDAGPPSLTSP